MKRTLAAALVLLVLLLTGCTGGGDVSTDDPILLEFESQTWKLTCSGGKNSIDAQTAQHFAQLVYRETNGAVTVEVSTGDKLTDGDAAAGLQNLLDGGADLSLYSSLLWGSTDERFHVLTLPFLFSSEADAARTLDGAGGDALAAVLEEFDQHCIGIGSGGFRCPSNNLRPITSPEDLKGLRLRVEEEEVLRSAYALWGVECRSLSWPLVYTALRTGTLDGQEMPLEDADASSIQAVQKHVTNWTALYSGVFFTMNRELYDSLSVTLREIVDECGRQTVEYQRRLAAESAQRILSSWQKAKVTITTLAPEAAAEFRAAAQPCYDAFARNVSADLLAAFPQ